MDPCQHVTKTFMAPSTSEWQVMQVSNTCFLEYPGIFQLVNTTKSSVHDHRLGTTFWKCTAAQHFACFQRQLRGLGVLHQRYTHHELRGGGATDHWLQCRGSPRLRRRGRWTSERTLERFAQEGTFLHHQNCSSEKLQTVSVLSARACASFLCRARLQKVLPPAPAATTLKRIV